MKLIPLFVLSAAAGVAFAQSSYRPFETTEEARQRHNVERYHQHQRQGTPLGGYQSPLGDPAPRGTESPGYSGTSTWQPPQNRDRDSNPYETRRRGW